MWFAKICLLVAVCLPAVVRAQQCLEDWACWEVRQQDDAYEFWVTNLKPYVFTASLKDRARHMHSSDGRRRSYQAVETVPGQSERLVLTLYATKGHDLAEYRDVFYWTPGDLHAVHDKSFKYLPPFAPNESYSLVQGFGGGWSHSGASKYAVDFAMPVGTAVHAARGGVVVQAVSHHNQGGSDRRYAKYANYVVILHEDGTTGEYYHLQNDGVVVSIDQRVEAGDLLGYSGNTGFSSIPHLHFAVYRPRPMGDFESLPFEFSAGLATRRKWSKGWWW